MSKFNSKTKVVTLTALAASTAMVAYANQDKVNNKAEENVDNAKLVIDKVDKDTVKISIDNVNNSAKAFQLSLKIEGNAQFASGENNIKWLTNVGNTEGEIDTTVVNDYKLSQNNKVIDIFVAGDKELPKKGSLMEICEINVEKTGIAKNSTYKIVPNTDGSKIAYKSIDENNKSIDEANMLFEDTNLSINTPPKINLKDTVTPETPVKETAGEAPVVDKENEIITITEGYEFDAKSFVEVSDEEDTNIGNDNIEVTDGDKNVINGAQNNLKSGTHERNYKVTDSAGESSTLRVSVVVKPEVWTTAPTITGIPQEQITVYTGTGFDPLMPDGENKVVAKDARNNPLDVELSGDFNLEVEGKYTLTYTAKDKFNNTTSQSLDIVVVQDNAPVINGIEDITINQGDEFDPKAGVSVSDDNANLTLDDLVISGSVNTNIASVYKLNYEISDGVNTTTKQRTVTVKAVENQDKEAPKFVYNGKTNITLNNGDSFEEPNVTVTDNVDKELVIDKIITNEKGQVVDKVDTKVGGKYEILYTTMDKAGNQAELVINVTVKEYVGGIEIGNGDGISENSALEIKVSTEVSGLENLLNAIDKDKYEAKVYGNPTIDTTKNEATYTLKLYKKQGFFARLFSLNKSDEVYYVKVTVKNTDEFTNIINKLPKEDSTGGGINPSVPPTSVTQLIGGDRYETATKISKEGWSSSDTIIVVNGNDKHLVDGLTATPLATAKNAPILLSNDGVLPQHTIDEIKRLNPSKVILIGGEGATPNTIVDAIKDIDTTINVQRIGGVNRYETSLNIAKEIDKTNNITTIYVGGGYGEADSLSISPVAGREKAPIILTNKDGLDKATYDYIKSQNIANGYVIGGNGVISDETVREIDSIVSADVSKNRIAGKNRQETNAKVIEKFYKDTKLNGVIVAKHYDLVDALSVGPLAGKKDIPVVLATDSLHKSQEDILNTKKSPEIYETGGGISSSVIDKVKELVK